jgi:hypothetical protein
MIMKKWVILLAVAGLCLSPFCFAESAKSHDVLQTLPGVPNNNVALTDTPRGVENRAVAPQVGTPIKKKRTTHPLKRRYSKYHRHNLHKKLNTGTRTAAHKKVTPSARRTVMGHSKVTPGARTVMVHGDVITLG